MLEQVWGITKEWDNKYAQWRNSQCGDLNVNAMDDEAHASASSHTQIRINASHTRTQMHTRVPSADATSRLLVSRLDI